MSLASASGCYSAPFTCPFMCSAFRLAISVREYARPPQPSVSVNPLPPASLRGGVLCSSADCCASCAQFSLVQLKGHSRITQHRCVSLKSLPAVAVVTATYWAAERWCHRSVQPGIETPRHPPPVRMHIHLLGERKINC